MKRHALFAGLVTDENENAVEVAYIGDDPMYVVDDAGFRRHIEAREIDTQVLAAMREQILSNKDLVTEGALKMMGKDDLFSKAMIDSSLEHLDEHFEKLMQTGLPPGAIEWMGMMGFRIVINYHGEIVRLQPEAFGVADDE